MRTSGIEPLGQSAVTQAAIACCLNLNDRISDDAQVLCIALWRSMRLWSQAVNAECNNGGKHRLANKAARAIGFSNERLCISIPSAFQTQVTVICCKNRAATERAVTGSYGVTATGFQKRYDKGELDPKVN